MERRHGQVITNQLKHITARQTNLLGIVVMDTELSVSILQVIHGMLIF